MSVNLEYKAKKYLIFKMKEIEADALAAMKKYAPAPGKNSPNQYNMSTGNLQEHITSSRRWWTVTVTADVPYAQYADKGRPRVKAYRVPYLKFIGADGRVHRAKEVAAMKGWNFEAKAAAEIRAKWG